MVMIDILERENQTLRELNELFKRNNEELKRNNEEIREAFEAVNEDRKKLIDNNNALRSAILQIVKNFKEICPDEAGDVVGFLERAGKLLQISDTE